MPPSRPLALGYQSLRLDSSDDALETVSAFLVASLRVLVAAR